MRERKKLPAGMTPRLLSHDQAAAYCGISPSHFDVHVDAAVGHIKLGGRRLWDRLALDRWLDGLSFGGGSSGQDHWVEALGRGADRAPPGRRRRPTQS
ncbi:MAG: hypothetical protein ACHQF3_00175 [Alphaproteobacteria bacterium]